jgi:predicted nuclease of predicted toxin-antitoxin system
MRFLAKENTPREAVQAVRAAGHDVAGGVEVAPGAGDETVLASALHEHRVLLTLDKDFGELVFRRGRDASCGVILLRPRTRSPEVVSDFFVKVLSQPIEWVGCFTVAREGSIRVRPLP